MIGNPATRPRPDCMIVLMANTLSMYAKAGYRIEDPEFHVLMVLMVKHNMALRKAVTAAMLAWSA